LLATNLALRRVVRELCHSVTPPDLPLYEIS